MRLWCIFQIGNKQNNTYIYLNMLKISKKKREIKNKKNSIPILPPSPSKNIEIPCDSANLNCRPNAKIQSSNALFDPNSASPSSEFMTLLKLRMSVYYEQDINIL